MSQPTATDGPEGLIVFRCGDRGYSCLEVLQAADFRGEVDPLQEAFLDGFGRATRAEDLELEVPRAALDALTESFRYERNLIRAEETERWLEERRLTLGDYEEFFVRQYWKSADVDELDEAEATDGADESCDVEAAAPDREIESFDRAAEPAGEEIDADEMRRLLLIDLHLTGKLQPMASALAWRVAALAAGDGGGPSAEQIGDERRRFFKRSGTNPSKLATWLARFDCDPEWFEDLLHVEAAFRQRCASVLTREARERMLRAQRLEFIRLDFEVLELDSPDAAHEAYLCAVEDGTSLRELAADERYPYMRAQVLANRLEDEGRLKLLSAKPGEVLPPTNGPESYQLCRVVDKIEPSVDDEEIRERLDDLLVSAHFAELAGRQVRWLFEGDGAG